MPVAKSFLIGPFQRVGCALLLTWAPHAVQAAQAAQAHGLWRSADQRAVIAFAPCHDRAEQLCGTIAWDADAGTPADTCGVLIARLKRHDGEAWRDGWAYDPRSHKHYKAVLRVQQDTLKLRAFIGTELLGETEEMKRVSQLPPGCAAQP
ncbi:DUF2147 domain-containing protein [Aquabacterium sp.]|uniref:DUF2147 domain-containing protein n=1 Tax=Aquabacterium sp. TaxID=1872578 RepID=UPI0027B9E9AE|nr:DUF2147 domain-containing protein [Aquabacterium sp.]